MLFKYLFVFAVFFLFWTMAFFLSFSNLFSSHFQRLVSLIAATCSLRSTACLFFTKRFINSENTTFSFALFSLIVLTQVYGSEIFHLQHPALMLQFLKTWVFLSKHFVFSAIGVVRPEHHQVTVVVYNVSNFDIMDLD